VTVALGDGVRMRMVMESEGWWERMSLPSSTMETRCPLPMLGYRTMVSFILDKNVKLSFCVMEFLRETLPLFMDNNEPSLFIFTHFFHKSSWLHKRSYKTKVNLIFTIILNMLLTHFLRESQNNV